MVLCMQYSVISTRSTCPYGSRGFGSMHKGDFWGRIKTLYWSQTTPVVFCMQYSVISSRITCLFLSQWFLHAKTATFGAELKLSTGPRPHLSFCAYKPAWLASFYRFHPSSEVLYMKTGTLGPDLQVCMAPRPQLWFWVLITACLAQE